jgi:hypothetical protein
VPDDRTLGELARQIEGMRRDNQDQFASLNAHIGRLVSHEYLALVEARLSDRVSIVVADIAEEKAERKTELSSIRSFQRYLVGVLVAVAAILVPLVLNLTGV